jgi:cytochrome b561
LLCRCACRQRRKALHGGLHAAALVVALAGVSCAVASHVLKRPTPTPNFYSAHSYLGVATLVLLLAQVGCVRQGNLACVQCVNKRSVHRSAISSCGPCVKCASM